MVTLTYIDAYQVERTTTYPNLAACILAFSGCVTLPDSYSIVSIKYKGKSSPIQGESMDSMLFEKVEQAEN